MQQFTWETNLSRRVSIASTHAIAGLWPAPRAQRAMARRRLAVGVAHYPADDEHDGWQPIRLRRHVVVSIANACRLRKAG